MMDNRDIAHTSNVGERVASIYADIYFDDDYCGYEKITEEPSESSDQNDIIDSEEWKSPSDLLIGKLELIPPFTSKIHRGITHQGILALGNGILQRERERLNRYIEKLLHDQDIIWNQISDQQKALVEQRVHNIYDEIRESKSKIMMNEIHKFYESTLQELEDHMRTEVSNLLKSTHASIISDANEEIKKKLAENKENLQKVLDKRYDGEVKKLNEYYSLLLQNEENKYNKTLNEAIYARNDALKAFYHQVQSETLTSTMYVMCTERKKCRIKQFLLKNYYTAKVDEKLKIIEEQEKILRIYKERDKHITELNREWEEKLRKILSLFFKFISFSLKLLPDQATFLLDLEKMVVLQLNELLKSPKASSILIDENDINKIEFIKPEEEEKVCDKEPFILVGDLEESIPTPHGSRETLASDVPLPALRLQRQFIYAKCDKFEEVKDYLEFVRCKCRDVPMPPSPPPEEPQPVVPKTPTPETESSSFEHLVMDDIKICEDCPARSCQDWIGRFNFPDMDRYLDFTEGNYRRVKDIVGAPQEPKTIELISAKSFIYQELPFSKTFEKTLNVGTQYSSQEDLLENEIPCKCSVEYAKLEDSSDDNLSMGKELEHIMKKRRQALQRTIHENPKLLKMFTDEDFDFLYAIK